MKCLAFVALLACVSIGSLAVTDQSNAEVVISVNKSTQRMHVVVDGVPKYNWAVSTGDDAHVTPVGSYYPDRLERKWFSRKYDMSPMPHSIFFFKGFAIHGTNSVSRLGRRASHGCVRLHPTNAAILFDLVKRQGMAATRINVSESSMLARR
jgi:lipoprotein-anchoring transpeptidase ErfK/SrfK